MAEGPPTIPDNALPPCCVRIDVNGSHAGSGFFVAPGTVLTCYHVLKLEALSSEEARASISVVSPPRGTTYRLLDAREWSPADEDDLAILRIEPADDHPFVLLDTGLRARDELHTFGFPDGYPTGAPAALVAEGWMQADRWLKVAQGQVKRGMSGSPVLNIRTGAVCGILKRSSDPSQALGGYAVSVRQLLKLSPTLGSANIRHHTTHRRAWFDLLPEQEQKLLLSQRTSARPSLPWRVLVISVGQSADAWEVTATVYGREADSADWKPVLTRLGPVTVDLNSVRALVARVFRDWASRDVTTRGRVEPGDQIRLLGEILSKALLPAQIGKTFDEALSELDRGWLEVALHFSEVDDADFREFMQLPWEYLYLPQRQSRGDVYFAREPKLAFVRAFFPEPQTPDPPAGKLSLLVVAVKPAGDEGSGDDARIQRDVDGIVSGLRELHRALSDALEVTVIESPDKNGLIEELSTGNYDALHYVGFGRFQAGTDRVALSVSPTGQVGYLNASDFADCLEGAAARVVVLHLCRGGETVPADLAAFGPSLLMKGTLGVIAYQYPVSPGLAQKFDRALYGALAEGAPLELAAQIARKKVWSTDSEGRAFLAPAVFVRSPGGLRVTSMGRETGLRSRVGALSGHG
jgi:hypothetical protein